MTLLPPRVLCGGESELGFLPQFLRVGIGGRLGDRDADRSRDRRGGERGTRLQIALQFARVAQAGQRVVNEQQPQLHAGQARSPWDRERVAYGLPDLFGLEGA